ncbi:MAG: serine/threonine protein kinase, partial [bacterium]|nr:serine/threonine protein kinase [bacterium]
MTDRLIGITLGKYQVIEKIGQGGMGTVYKGRQLSLNRAVAIKMLPGQMAADEDFVKRFRQEAEVIAGLTHENIVYVYDIDQFENTYFIVMEFVDGYSLRQLRAGRPMSPEEVRAVGISVARALQYAHERGIIHRDIKSANVMVTHEGKVKLMDFGIAKAAGSGIKTVTGSVLGTPEYMAPEQARTGRTSPQSDVYSLGVMLYELATGGLPFAAEDPFAIALKHVSEEPEPPQARVPSIPDWLNRIILHAMAKDLGQRYATAAEIEHDLLAAGGAGVTGTLQALSGVAPVESTQPMSTPPGALPVPSTPVPSTPVPPQPGQTPYPSPTFTESATLPSQQPPTPPPTPGSGPWATPPAIGDRSTPPPRQASYTPTPQPPYTPTPTPQPPYTPTPQPPYQVPGQGAVTPPPPGTTPPPYPQGAPLAGTVVATEAPTMPPTARGRSVPLWAVVVGGIAIVAVVVIAAMLAFGPSEPPAVEVEAAQAQPASGPTVPTATGTSATDSEGRSVVLTEEQKRQIDQKLGPEPGREQPPETSEQAPGSL